MLPAHFPPRQTVYWWFRRFVRRLLFGLIHDMTLMIERQECERESEPTTGMLDSHSVKAPHAQHRGYDAGKKVSDASGILRWIPMVGC
jgi:putative transposase